MTEPRKRLVPSDANSAEVLGDLAAGEIVRCKIERPRNAKHHRLAFALMKEVYKNQKLYSTFEIMYDALKVATGHFDLFVLPGGEKVLRPRSLAWHLMDQTEFEHWWSKFLDVILNQILPATNKAALEKHIYDMLGERGPEK